MAKGQGHEADRLRFQHRLMMIHWHEGLHLLPQHFQGLQRLALEVVAAERLARYGFGGGILRMDLNLTREVVSVREFTGVTRSGILLEYPTTVQIAPREIGAEFSYHPKGFTLRLGIPAWTAHGPNAYAMGATARKHEALRYLPVESPMADENDGGEKRPVWTRKYNARLILESDRLEEAQWDLITLGRVLPSSGGQEPHLDESSCPAILRMRAWPKLQHLLDELVSALDGGRGSLTGRMGEGGFNLDSLHGNQLGLLLRLRTVNHFYPRLKALAELDSAAPFEVYREMASLWGELMALDPFKERTDFPAFDHKGPYEAFRTLDQLIRRNLETLPLTPTTPIRLNPDPDQEGLYVASLPVELLAGGHEVHLQIDAEDANRGDVRELVASPSFKLAAHRRINDRRYGGVRPEPVDAPLGYPAQAKYKYFQVRLSSEILSELRNDPQHSVAVLLVPERGQAQLASPGVTLIFRK